MEGAPNHLQTTWVWIGVSYLAEQLLRCDLLKVSLQDPQICPQLKTGKSVGEVHKCKIMSMIICMYNTSLHFAWDCERGEL